MFHSGTREDLPPERHLRDIAILSFIASVDSKQWLGEKPRLLAKTGLFSNLQSSMKGDIGAWLGLQDADQLEDVTGLLALWKEVEGACPGTCFSSCGAHG